jgi:hypothetical protein
MKKLLMVDLKNPQNTGYWAPYPASIYLLGKRTNNYLYFIIGEDGHNEQIVLESAEIKAIEKQFENALTP